MPIPNPLTRLSLHLAYWMIENMIRRNFGCDGKGSRKIHSRSNENFISDPSFYVFGYSISSHRRDNTPSKRKIAPVIIYFISRDHEGRILKRIRFRAPLRILQWTDEVEQRINWNIDSIQRGFIRFISLRN